MNNNKIVFNLIMICSICKVIVKINEVLKTSSYCKSCRAKNSRLWRLKNKDKVKQQNQKYYNDKGGKEKKVIYDKINLEKIRIKERERYYSDMNFRLKKILRTRLNKVINGKRKDNTSIELLGCNLEYFKSWLEYQFTENMSWDNYGTFWNIDHVKPCSSFDFFIIDEQKRCFNWTNTRPLKKCENESKNNKVDILIIDNQKELVKLFINGTKNN